MEQNILITGSTGLIGQHILYEQLPEYIRGHKQGKIYLLIRRQEGRDGAAFIRGLLQNAWTPDFVQQGSANHAMDYIQIIEGDIRDRDLGMILKKHIPDRVRLQVFHSAGSVNLHVGQEAEQDVFHHNFLGTQSFLHALQSYDCRFMFIGTAFSSGIRTGLIDDHFLHSSSDVYRNPYEQSKAAIETMIQEYGAKKQMTIQIARPSVVVGRLLTAPLYYTSKFDVIYGWGRFFWMMKEKNTGDGIRIHINPNSGMNIVPVDYVAKACLRLSHTNRSQLNIVQAKSVHHAEYLSRILDAVGFANYAFVDKKPINLKGLEKIYYRSVGSIFSPYLTGPCYEYDTSVLNQIMADIPSIDIPASIEALIQFAVAHRFEEQRIHAAWSRAQAACHGT